MDQRPAMRSSPIRVPVPQPFDLRLALFGHGFVDLAPNQWLSDRQELVTAIEVGGRGVDVQVAAEADGLVIRSRGARSPRERREVAASLVHVLRLDDDLAPFWKLCRREASQRWIARRGAGRLTRSPTLFEDLSKLLMTTNCSWAATRNMASHLVDALGAPTPSGRRAFPTAEACAKKSEAFFRDQGRLGYRASALRRLARDFATGALCESDFRDESLATHEVRDRLLALPGFGPYAAGQALRLLGRYDDFALDAWCRGRLAARSPSGRAPSERTLAKRYRRFGQWRGLALWMDLTADWHGEAPALGKPVLRTGP